MTEAVTPIDKQPDQLRFLDMDEAQFATVIYMASVGSQMRDYIGTDKLRDEMLKTIQSGKYTNVMDALAWVRGSRNAILQLNGASSFALNILAQVEDLIIDRMLSVATANDQPEENK